VRSIIVVVFALCLAVAAARTRATANQADAPVTFNEHVAPILFRHCSPCHRPGEAAPFPLTSFAAVRPRARRIAAVTESRTMPPWKPAPSDYAFRDARRLTDAQIAIFRRWVADGMLEGDPKKLPPMPRFTPGWQLGPPDLVVTMGEPFEVPATGPDIYRSFVVPLNLRNDAWVRAIDFRPSARSVVHHSLFFVDDQGAGRWLDEGDKTPGFDGGMGGVRLLRLGVAGGLAALLGGRPIDAQFARGIAGLGGWALGGRALELPAGLAFFVRKGSDLILSTHFHSSGRLEKEQSTIGLYFADAPPTENFTAIHLPPLFGALEGLAIPPGDDRYTISDSFTLPIDVRVFQVAAHAHYLGKEMKLTATLPDGRTKTLLWITDWDFGWQEAYQFREFVALPKGTRLEAFVRYDNTTANRRNPNRPPVRVTWGEASTDEMGALGLQLVAARGAELPVLQQAFADHVRAAVANRPRPSRQRRPGW
jgi:hypothetical protein